MSPEPDDDDWLSRAKCKGLPTSMFIPNGPGGSLDRAVAVCHGWDGGPPCPVRSQCYDAGQANSELGVWGGQIRGQKHVRIVVPLNKIQDARPRHTS